MKNSIVSYVEESSGTFVLDFLGEKEIFHTSAASIEAIANRRSAAYHKIPKGCEYVIPSNMGPYNNKLMGGVLKDSITVVYGITKASNFADKKVSIPGYNCSIFFKPSKEIILYLNLY